MRTVPGSMVRSLMRSFEFSVLNVGLNGRSFRSADSIAPGSEFWRLASGRWRRSRVAADLAKGVIFSAPARTSEIWSRNWPGRAKAGRSTTVNTTGMPFRSTVAMIWRLSFAKTTAGAQKVRPLTVRGQRLWAIISLTPAS